MKKIFAIILLFGVIIAVSVPVVNAVETEQVTLGDLKAMYRCSPRCK